MPTPVYVYLPVSEFMMLCVTSCVQHENYEKMEKMLLANVEWKKTHFVMHVTFYFLWVAVALAKESNFYVSLRLPFGVFLFMGPLL